MGRISRLVISVLCGTALALTSYQVASASPSTTDTDVEAVCVTAMDSPHFSAGAGGVIAKFRYCDEIRVNVDVTLFLFLCPVDPGMDEDTWASKGCVQRWQQTYAWTASPFNQYTRYVPPSGVPGLRGTGWWTACAYLRSPYTGNIPAVARFISA
jgi:hypothetical protein